MIRINLLSEGRRPVIARRTRPKLALGDQDPSVLLLAAGLVLGLLWVGIQWWMLRSDRNEINAKVAVAQREVDELRPILEEVADFKAKQAELERKIAVINELTLKQRGPVHIMDKVSRALPELLWLNQMSVRGTTVDLNGTAFNTSAVAAFIENLDKVPEFKEPDPKSMNSSRNGTTYDFQISFNFVQEEPETGDEDLDAIGG